MQHPDAATANGMICTAVFDSELHRPVLSAKPSATVSTQKLAGCIAYSLPGCCQWRLQGSIVHEGNV